jgi:predicted transcriptional regulator of viral defense system
MSKKLSNIIKICELQCGYAYKKDFINSNIYSYDINCALEENIIFRIKNGLYRLVNIDVVSNQNFIDVMYALPLGVICLVSALSYYELTTFNSHKTYIALYRQNWRPKIYYPPTDIYYFSKKQFEIGIETVKIGKKDIQIYSPEKTICDCFRYRNKLGVDIVKEGLTEYLKWKKRDISKLLKYAEICRIKSSLEDWLMAMI